jgi:uncharacterized protein
MRFLIILGLVYLVYRMIRPRPALRRGPVNTDGADGDMIQDRVCGIYFSRQTGVRITYNGEDTYFCSNACRDRFLAGESGREDPPSP